MDPFEEQVLRRLQEGGLLEGLRHLVVAVSGGPDSVALFLALHRTGRRHGCQLTVAHLHHGRRGREADEDQDFVRALAVRHGVPVHLGRLRLREVKGNWEARARKARYRFLFEQALSLGEGVGVATGHTADDQLETFLLKLIRGAGPRGLGGIYPVRWNRFRSRSLKVIRPLLGSTRRQVLAYLERLGQAYRVDRSNLDLSYDRNLLRERVLPILRELNPRVAEHVDHTSLLLREIDDYLCRKSQRLLGELSRRDEEDLVLEVKRLLGLHPVMRREVIRRGVERAGGEVRRLTRRHLRDLQFLLEGSSGRELQWPGGLRLLKEFEQLRLTRTRPIPPFRFPLPVPGRLELAEVGKAVGVSRVRAHTPLRTQPPGGAELIHLPGPLEVRNRRPGDRYCPTGEGAPRKLKEIFQEKQVPCSRRDRLLVFEWEGRIVWVEGLEVPDRWKRQRGQPGLRIRVRSLKP